MKAQKGKVPSSISPRWRSVGSHGVTFSAGAGLMSFKSLVAYGHVTSLDGDPTWRERLQVWWMRLYVGFGVVISFLVLIANKLHVFD